MKRLLIIISVIISLLLIYNISVGDEGSFPICNIQSFSISYDDQIERIILPCSGDAQSLYLNVINPASLQVDRSFYFNGLIQESISMNNGASLLVHLGELDGNSSTEEGMLAEVEYSTGNIIRTLNLDRSPNVMVIDPSESNAYLSIGLYDPYNPQEVVKVSLYSFQIIDEFTFGEFTNDIEITPNGYKIYVNSANVFPELSPSHSKWGIGIFNTSDLTLSNRIIMEDSAPFLLEMSYDGSELYISSGYFGSQRDTGASIYIVNTTTDEIVETIHLTYNGQKVGTWSLACDCRTNKLYCTSEPLVGEFYEKSNLICELNLDDYSYSYFTMGDNPISRIALAPMQNGSRLFAIEEDSPIVHYKDLP